MESVVPRDTWRGQFHAGTSPTTGVVRDCPVGVQTNCLLIAWPGWKTTASHSWGGEEAPDIDVWYGGLVDGMRDASGQMYMRNRYYDPATGQFTQTDPIGLAGGLNAYGFAAGDPVTYSDPYGLCPEEGTSFDCPILLEPVTVVGSRYRPMEVDETSILIGGPGLIGRAATPVVRPLLARLGNGLRQLLGRSVVENSDRALLQRFFGQGMKGVQERARDFSIPEGLGREALTRYRRIATEAIERGMDKSGVQAERIKLIDRALEELP